MNILVNCLAAIVALAFGFLVGGIPNGVLIGKIFFKKDPRDFGSKNSGGTNSGRVFGKKIGIAVIVLDLFKSVIAFWTVWAIIRFSGLREIDGISLFDDGVLYTWLAVIGCAFGHCYSPYLKFKGGKAVAVYYGAVGGTSWIGFAASALVFFPLFKSKRLMSRASLLSGGIMAAFEWGMYLVRFLVKTYSQFNFDVFMWNFGFGGGVFFGWESATAITIVYLLMVFRHRKNIQRLKEGTEKPVEWGSL